MFVLEHLWLWVVFTFWDPHDPLKSQYFATSQLDYRLWYKAVQNMKQCASLLGCKKNKLESFGLHFFVGDVICWVGFRSFWLRLPYPGHQLLTGIFWLKFFFLETRILS